MTLSAPQCLHDSVMPRNGTSTGAICYIPAKSNMRHSNFYTHALYKIWHRCYMDKRDFGQSKLLLCQKDILELCRKQAATPQADMYIVPRDPISPLSSTNAVLVDRLQRRVLIALWRLGRDRDEYTRHVVALINRT